MIKQKKKEFCDEELIAYMKIPPRKKLRFLYEMNRFLMKVTPKKSKKIWEKLQKEGY